MIQECYESSSVHGYKKVGHNNKKIYSESISNRILYIKKRIEAKKKLRCWMCECELI